MTLFASGNGVSVTREIFQPTKETPIKPFLLILMNAKDSEVVDPFLLILTNAKDNEVINLISYHASLIPCCFTHW